MTSTPDAPDDRLVVGRVGKAHGLRGEVTVDVRTDDPDARFAPGSVLETPTGTLTVADARWHSGRLLVAFEGAVDRTTAEALRGTVLLVDPATLPPLDDPDEYRDHDLVGLAVVLPDGAPLGTVAEVLHPPGGDVLAVRRERGPEVLVPFVAALVPEVDLTGGRVVVDPPPGLLDLNDRAEPGD